MKLAPAVKRKLIQIAAFGFTNFHLENYYPTVQIDKGPWKAFCQPGLNCYSCPAAAMACPIGALQAVGGSMDFSFSFYVAGFLLAVGVLLGRAVCGFLCPFGLIQELIGKLPFRKHRLPKWTKYIKYLVLLWFVFLWPYIQATQSFLGLSDPTFCEYICPAGLLMAGVPLLLGHEELAMAIGPVFSAKLFFLVMTVVGCALVYRFFCKVLCPLGAIYGLLNRFSFFRVHIDPESCVKCGRCAKVCRMDVDPVKNPDSPECIRCGECAHACPHAAIHVGYGKGKPRPLANNTETTKEAS